MHRKKQCFARSVSRTYCRTFFALTNQTLCYIGKCVKTQISCLFIRYLVMYVSCPKMEVWRVTSPWSTSYVFTKSQAKLYVILKYSTEEVCTICLESNGIYVNFSQRMTCLICFVFQKTGWVNGLFL